MARGRQGNGRHGGGGNAQTLRNYWTRGEGATKIRWGTPGDFNRCVRHLSKYMGARAKGYCALRHKAATGMWTSQHAKALRGGAKRR
ncbi:hypothetical protein ACFY2M_19205 [Streptomyces sp. NPDC001276]|uniref:hypothetical protein n=1 Tax=Streptomyces sp. NPDC001276 TaxID=3364555 RepID=UPI0036CD51C1